VKNTRWSDHFWTFRCCFACHGKGLWTLSKVSKTWGFCSISKKIAGVGHLKRICKDAFSVAGAEQKTCSPELLGGQGADFLRGLHFGALGLQFWEHDFAWQVQHFVWPGITFSWQAQYFRQVEKSQNPLVRGRQLCTQLSIFEGCLAELLRVWCCQHKNMRKSRWIVSFRNGSVSSSLASRWVFLVAKSFCRQTQAPPRFPWRRGTRVWSSGP